MTESLRCTELLERWCIVKQELKATQDELARIEEGLLPHLETKGEGSVTQKIDNFKITVTTRINRTFDEIVWESIKQNIDPNLAPVKTKTVLDEKGWKFLLENHKDVAEIVSKAVTEKPGKPGIKIEEL